MNWRRLLPSLAWYLRHVPDHPGRWRLASLAVEWAPHLKERKTPVTIRARQGRFRVDGTSQTGRMLFATGEYEPGSTRILERALKPGDTMIDVGANIGYFAVVASRAVGPHGRVLAFEPQPDVRRRLAANLDLNALTNVTVRSEALGASSGEVTLYTGPRDDTGLASLRPLPESTAVTIPLVRFDDLWDGSPVRLIKIDVEGAEMEVLAGMAGCLRRDHPDVIAEVTDEYLRALGSSARAMFDWMTAFGYRMFEIAHDGALRAIDGPDDLERSPSQFNALFSVGAAGGHERQAGGGQVAAGERLSRS
ncbi:MAG: FkbM family methyltransferase [Acidobacteria bacterium]|nr:FkbM family methyltransferase [Acidobacteriota bacterium]